MPENINLQQAVDIIDRYHLESKESTEEIKQAWSVVKDKISAIRTKVDKLVDLVNKYESDD